MYLTKEEERMLSGEYGEAVREAMRILVTLGDAFDAEHMIPISSVHNTMGSVASAGDSALEYLQEMIRKGARFRVSTTVNNASIDLNGWRNLGFPEELAVKQFKFTAAWQALGGVTCHTCTPYLVGNIPSKGDHVSWGEVSAITFVNSVIGARTNREGGYTSLASSIAGRVPLYGYHLDENRRGNVLVEVKAQLKTVSDFGALSYHVGTMVGDRVPVFSGLRQNPSIGEYKALCAVCGSFNAGALFHIVGMTPEARTMEEAFRGEKPEEKISVNDGDVERAYNSLTTATGGEVDSVCVGCPHCSIEEIEMVANLLRGKKVCDDVKFWVCTAVQTKVMADRMGYTGVIENAGARVVSDTCPVALKDTVVDMRFRIMATNSVQNASYAPWRCGLQIHFGTLQECIEASIKGRWTGRT